MKPISPISANFDQRLKQVKDEIERRIESHKPDNRYFMRSRLWNAWLEKNVWSEVSHA